MQFLGTRRSDKYLVSFFVIFLCVTTYYIATKTLFYPNNHTDNLYNKGVVLRSANSSSHLLETSYLHWFFYDTPIVHAEDWHRSLSLIVQRFFAERFPYNQEWFIRIPHFLWTILWLGSAISIYIEINRELFYSQKIPFLLGSILVVSLLVFNNWSLAILSAAFLDDVLGTIFVLLGIFFILRKADSNKTALAGLFFGMAYLAKDFNLIWGGIGFLLILVTEKLYSPERSLSTIFGNATLYLFLLIAVYTPKFLWNWHDFGVPLFSPARTALNARLLPNLIDGEHYFFVSKRMQVPGYFHAVNLVGCFSILLDGLKALFQLFKYQILSFMIFPIGIFFSHFQEKNKKKDLLLNFIWIGLISYFLFFVLRLGEATQTRYWLAPLSLIAIFFASTAAKGLAHPFRSVFLQKEMITTLIVVFFLLALNFFPRLNSNQNNFFAHDIPYQAETIKAINNQMQAYPDSSVLLNTNSGVLVWSEFPQLEVVAVKPFMLPTLSSTEFQELIEKYDVKMAAFSNPDNELLALLTNNGFEVFERIDQDVIFQYKP